MKKTFFAIAAIALLTTGVSMAQRGYNPNADRNQAPYHTPSNSRYDNVKEDINIDRLDAIVNLSRKQQKEMKRIEDRFDKMAQMTLQRRNPQAYKRLQAQKQSEILDVLTKKQRDKWFAFQQANNRFDRNKGYGRRS